MKPMPRFSEHTITRFWSLVDKTPSCWLWRHRPNSGGYGLFSVWSGGERSIYRAHRVAWVLSGRSLDPDLVLDHICRVRTCVRPDHLRQVDTRTNSLAGLGAAAMNARKTHCKRGHEFTPENTYFQPRGTRGRQCRQCARARRDEYDSKRRAKADVR